MHRDFDTHDGTDLSLDSRRRNGNDGVDRVCGQVGGGCDEWFIAPFSKLVIVQTGSASSDIT